MTSQPSLTLALKLPSLVLFGLAYLTPLIVLAIFGVITKGFRKAPPEMAMEEKEAALV